MGNIFENSTTRLLLIGLDAAGKTHLLYHLAKESSGNEVISNGLVSGFYHETLKYKSIEFISFDVGGQHNEHIFKRMSMNIDGIIWMIDSNDRERITDISNPNQYYKDTVKWRLHNFLTYDSLKSKSIPLLILCNKQDLPNSMSMKEISDKLDLNLWIPYDKNVIIDDIFQYVSSERQRKNLTSIPKAIIRLVIELIEGPFRRVYEMKSGRPIYIKPCIAGSNDPYLNEFYNGLDWICKKI